MTRIAVIGGGIAGVTTAYALAKRGLTVHLFDRHRYAAMETSFANGGQLSASNAEVWNHPSTLAKGVRWMFTADAPLLVNPKPSWHKLSWFCEFIANMRRYEPNTVSTARLAITAREFLFEWAREESIHFDLKKRGILHVYREEAGFRHAERVNALLAKGGLRRDAVTPAEIRSIEPTLNGAYFGGFYTESDSTGDIHKFTVGLAEAAQRRGAMFHYGATVNRMSVGLEQVTLSISNSCESTTQSFDVVVVCAGTASRELARQAGDRINVYPVKGYSITVNLRDEASQRSAPTVSLLDDEAKLVTSRLGDDRFRVAGTAEFNGFNYDIRADRIRPLTNWVQKCFPGVSTRSVVPWAGLRPMMPDMMPRYGRGKSNAVFYNTGHGHLGWTLSAATAQAVAEQIAAGRAH